MLLTDFDIRFTGNFHDQLKMCEGVRVMVAYNTDLEDRLINGSTGTVVHLQMPRASDPFHGTMYVKFDDPDAGKSHKNPCSAREKFWYCVAIIATMKTFPHCHKKFYVTV